ncbi:hypothetical protein [Pseudomonas chlororaphis]|uniref:Phage protein n=1 Tax=Pseudomonas chlororaphis O6 TaxID=1037915 RepID=A0AB33WL71_9PSED|nr:hypothetical protein [Pseudomonas chlororaphis]EIM13825.1 hypothetical protein PchlO6_2100 [Pseudomonas chlororaphis O6]
MPTENKPAEPFQREDRYIVIKRSDLDKMSPLDRDVALSNLEHVAALLFGWNAPERKCLVIESDWPEYEPAWQMVERRMTGQTPVTAAEELDAVLHWRGKHAQVIRERAALQADLDARDQRVDELEGLLRLARQFVVNGIDLGYIKMPDVDTPDPAHDLVPKIDAALNPTPKPHTCCGSCPACTIGAKP